jgi:hypothetical protein
MTSLFDKFVPAVTTFRPETATELFALRLAQKLDDAPAVRHYVDLTGKYSEAHLLCAFRRAVGANGNRDHSRRFHVELARIQENGNHKQYGKLISIRVERRTIAAAIFHGEHLEYADSRQLSSDNDRARANAAAFISWLLIRFPAESAALESIPNGHEFQRRVLHETIGGMLRERLLAIWEIPRSVLLDCYGYPPLKSRSELRKTATSIWPILAGTHAKVFIQDAAVLGLHVQTERLFIFN